MNAAPSDPGSLSSPGSGAAGEFRPLLTLERVRIGYGRSAVLPDLNLEFPRGSYTGLLGSNGSGKSTLIKTILGILPPLSGKVAFTPIDGRLPLFGYVPQRETLDSIFLLSSFEVVLMGVCGRVGPGRWIRRPEREWARHCLEETETTHLAGRQFSELSGGQKQRVLIARALAAKPDLLLLDEPTSGIDVNVKKSILEMLRRIHETQRMTILISSHDLSAVRAYAQRAVLLQGGQGYQGPVAELRAGGRLAEMLNLELP